MNAENVSKPGLWRQISGLPANFWYANLMEILERLAFFGVRAIAPLYLVAKSNDNGLSLTYVDKGNIYFWWALIQCLVPMVSGGFTERYGYRKSLVCAFSINIVGYLCMAQSKPLSDYLLAHGWAHAPYYVFLLGACLVALGTAIFKPPVHGTIAKSTDEETSSMGWGLFYWVVNIGGALAPMCAAQLRGEIDWHYVFYGAAIVTACNFLPLFILYREPPKAPKQEGESEKGVLATFFGSILTIFTDLRLVVFLLIFSCFWLMFMQLWDLLPNFIDEWVDTSDVATMFGAVSDGWILGNGQTKPEMIINLNSISIILLVLVVSWIIRKMNKVAAMIIGMLISMVGFVAAGATMLGWICCLMILVFSIGEMTCSPTFSAYVGLIAPKDKKALYMGYSNIPFAIGWAVGNLVGGYFYEAYGAKASLAARELAADSALVARAAQAKDWSGSLQYLPDLMGIERGAAVEELQAELGQSADAVAATLRDTYRYDRGQLANLALLYVAVHPDNRQKSIVGLARALSEDIEALSDAAGEFGADVRALLPDAAQPGADEAHPPTTEPAASSDAAVARMRASSAVVLSRADEVKRLVMMTRELAAGEAQLDGVGLARLVHVLPAALGIDRDDAFREARQLMNKERSGDARLGDVEVVRTLWERFGQDRDVLNNLALEYLAQGTTRLYDRIVSMAFRHGANELEKRVEEVAARLSISKDDAFGSLSIALGADDETVRQRIGGLELPAASSDERLFVYLMQQREHRFAALSDWKWADNQDLLRELIRSDEAALAIVRAEIDKRGVLETAFAAVRGAFGAAEEPGEPTEEGVDYKKLAGKVDLIAKALAAKNWTKTPEQAARVAAANRFEAGARIASDEQAAKRVLWDAHRPYMVWVYLGAIGLAGTLGMIIFYFATKRPANQTQAVAA